MRDYKFRGKRKGNGEWVIGSYVSTNPNEAFILLGVTGHVKRDDYECYMADVDPKTVGLYSTLSDQNMSDIYEGDVIKVAGRFLKVVFDAGCFLSLWGTSRYPLNQWGSEGVEIVGNIHDNPELLNPTSGQSGINHMLDPNNAQVAPANQEAIAEQVNEQATNAQESAAQDEATGASEEVTEG